MSSSNIQSGNSRMYSYQCSEATSCEMMETIIPKGIWRIECWGASGGDGYNPYDSYLHKGGKGGYSTGQILFKKDTKVYIFIGGQGLSKAGGKEEYVEGGSNGGGKGRNGKPYALDFFETKYFYGGSGGGATDVRIGGKEPNYRYIVAGGGGGGSAVSDRDKNYGQGGSGGGEYGIDGIPYDNSDGEVNSKGRGGNQTSGGSSAVTDDKYYSQEGSLGQGGDAATGLRSSSGGGGGGFYGGSGGAAAGGGGGSGYVRDILKKAFTVDGEHSFFAPNGGNETGHEGNGVVKFTLLGMRSDVRKSRIRFHPFFER